MMKFQKINLMLLTALAWGNISFSAEGERVARRSISPEEPFGEEMSDLHAKQKTAEEAQRKEDYEENLVESKKLLKLNPDKEHSDTDIHKSFTNPYNLGLTKADGSDEYSKARDFLLDHNETPRKVDAQEKTEEEARRKAIRDEKYRSAQARADKAAQGESSGDTVFASYGEDTQILKMPTIELSNPSKVTPDLIQNISPEALKEISKNPEKLRALLSNTEAIKALSEEQVQAIDPQDLAKAIKGTVNSKLDHYTSGEARRINELPNSFVDKITASQAKEIIKECDGIFGGRTTHLTDFFSKEQRDHLRELAKTTNDFNQEARTRATTLVKRLATKGTLTSNEENSLRDTIGALNRQQKEAVISSYADAIAQKNGLKEEKGKWWLFGNKKAESEGKIQTLTILLKSDVTKMMSDYGIKNDHVMFIVDPKTDAFTIRILNNKEVDQKILNIDPTQPIDKEIAKFINIKTMVTGVRTESVDYFVDRYTQKFISEINLSITPETEIPTILTKQNISPAAKDLNNLDSFASPLKEKVQSALSEKIITQLEENATKVNPGYMKYVVDVSKFSTDQIEALSADQIEAFSSDQVRNLNLDQIEALSTDQTQALNSSKMSNSQVKVILQKMIQNNENLLSDDQLKKLPKDTLQSALKSLKDSDLDKLEELLKESPFKKTITRELSKRATTTESNDALDLDETTNTNTTSVKISPPNADEQGDEEPVAPPALPKEFIQESNAALEKTSKITGKNIDRALNSVNNFISEGTNTIQSFTIKDNEPLIEILDTTNEIAENLKKAESLTGLSSTQENKLEETQKAVENFAAQVQKEIEQPVAPPALPEDTITETEIKKSKTALSYLLQTAKSNIKGNDLKERLNVLTDNDLKSLGENIANNKNLNNQDFINRIVKILSEDKTTMKLDAFVGSLPVDFNKQVTRNLITQKITSLDLSKPDNLDELKTTLTSMPKTYKNGDTIKFNKDTTNENDLTNFFEKQSKDTLQKLQKYISENNNKIYSAEIKKIISTAFNKSK